MILRYVGRETSAALALSALLFWAPLPAGSVTPAAELLFRLVACGLFLLAVSGLSRGRQRLPVLALSAVALLGLAQSCPWPAGVASVVSPEHVRLARQTAELDPVRSPKPSWVALSLDGSASRSTALSWLASAALLAAALVVGRRRAHRRWLLVSLMAAALVQIVYGLLRLHELAPDGLASVLLRPEGRLHGTFANPNHLSLFFELAMTGAAAWTWLEISRFRRIAERRRVWVVGPPLLWLILLTGVVLTGSRAGLAAAVLGSAAQALALALVWRSRKVGVVVALALLVVLATLVGIGSGLEIQRYVTVSLFEDNLRSRLLLLGPALALWRLFPATGTGLGTFEDGFPTVATPELTTVLWNRAHNDPLELLVTGGLVGVGIVLVALAALGRPIWRAIRKSSVLEDRAAGLAALGALAVAGVHELFDFGLVIPANALALLAILGSAAAVAPAAAGPNAESASSELARERARQEPAAGRSDG